MTDPNIRYVRETITLRIAEKYLASNADNNRGPKKSRIPAMARDMLTGNWNTNTGETIKFNSFGRMIDGQNRLSALILAAQRDPDIAIEFDVAYGVPQNAMLVIDSGSSRTFSDSLRIAEGHVPRMQISSIVRWAINWDGGNPMGGGSKIAPTHSELWDRYRGESGAFDAAGARAVDAYRQGLGVARAVGTAFYLFARIDKGMANEFFDQFISGQHLVAGMPALTVRNRMIRKVDRMFPAEQLAVLVRAWGYHRRGEELYKITVMRKRDTFNNDTFPRLER